MPVIRFLPTSADIETAARARGWSVSKLCREAGVSRATVVKWKNGSHVISLGNLQKLLDALHS